MASTSLVIKQTHFPSFLIVISTLLILLSSSYSAFANDNKLNFNSNNLDSLHLDTTTATKLQKYNVTSTTGITVSGLSSGGYFAVQFHIAHSALVDGCAVFAGGPFYCAESNVLTAQNNCMKTLLGGPNIVELINLTKSDFLLGYIDDPANLANDKVYLFSGKADTVVSPNIVHSLNSYYSTFVHTSNIVADFNVNAEHCMPTIDYAEGEDCATLGSPFIGKCGFDGAGHALQQLYGGGLKTGGVAVASNLIAFDQRPFFSSASLSSIGDTGYIYVPTACKSGSSSCRLHVSFHGCEQNLETIGNKYAAHAGYNDWAEANDIIVLYPYVKVSSTVPFNPNGW